MTWNRGPQWPQHIGRQVDALDRRLEEQVRNRPGTPGRRAAPSAVFDWSGAVATSIVSKGWEWGEAVTLHTVVARLRVAGISNTIVTLLKNNATFGTITLASGVFRATFTVPAAWRDFAPVVDVLQVQTTTAGASANDLAVWGHTWAMGT